MPRTYTATFYKPDGVTVDFSQEIADVPDNVHPNDVIGKVEAAAGRRVGELKAQPRGIVGEAKEVGKDLLRGAGKFGAMLLEGGAAINAMDRPNRDLPQGEVTAMVDKAIPTPVNDSPERQLGRKVIEGIGGAVPGGMGAPIRSAIAGGASALGAEAGQQAMGTPGMILGGLLGGTAAGAAMKSPELFQGNVPKIAREALKDVPPAELAAALDRMRANRSTGFPTNISQEMAVPTGLDDLVNDLAASRHGGPVIKNLRDQPLQLQLQSEMTKAGLPGSVQSPQGAANAAQQGATASIKRLQQAAGEAWRKVAPKDAAVPPEAVGVLDEKLAALAAKYPNQTAADMIEALRKDLRSGKPTTTAAKPLGAGPRTSQIMVPGSTTQAAYITDPLQLKGLIEDHLANPNLGSRALNTANPAAKLQRQAQEVREAFREMIDDHVPELTKANRNYSLVVQNSVNPAKQGPVGAVAGARGYADDKAATASRLYGLLDRGTLPGSATSEIRTLGKALNKQDPVIFQDVFKTWFAKQLDEAFTPTKGRIAEQGAAGVTNRLGPSLSNQTTAKSQGMKDSLDVLADGMQLEKGERAAFIDGVQKFLRMAEAGAKRPGSVTALPPGDLRQLGQESAIASTLQTQAVTPGWGLGKAIRLKLNSGAYEKLGELLATPEGVEHMVKLGKTPMMSKNAEAIFASYVSTAGAANSADDK